MRVTFLTYDFTKELRPAQHDPGWKWSRAAATRIWWMEEKLQVWEQQPGACVMALVVVLPLSRLWGLGISKEATTSPTSARHGKVYKL